MIDRVLYTASTIILVALHSSASYAMLPKDPCAAVGQFESNLTADDGSYKVAEGLAKKLRNLLKKTPSPGPVPQPGIPLRNNTYGPAPNLGPNALPPAQALPGPTGQYGPAPAPGPGGQNLPPPGQYTAAPAAPGGGGLPPPGGVYGPAPVGRAANLPPPGGNYDLAPGAPGVGRPVGSNQNAGALPPPGGPANPVPNNGGIYENVDQALDGGTVPFGGVANNGGGLRPNDPGVLPPRNQNANLYDRVDLPPPGNLPPFGGVGNDGSGLKAAANGGRLPPRNQNGPGANQLPPSRQANAGGQGGVPLRRNDGALVVEGDFYVAGRSPTRQKKSPPKALKVLAGTTATAVVLLAGAGTVYGLERGEVVDMGDDVKNAFDEFDSSIMGLANEN